MFKYFSKQTLCLKFRPLFAFTDIMIWMGLPLFLKVS